MADTLLYDHRGEVIRRKELRQEHAAPTLMGVRTAWNPESIASGLTPDRLAQVLMNAAQGDHSSYLTLAEEMEEREQHYASVLSTRKRAVSRLEPVVEAASDDKRDVDLADAVRNLIRRPGFRKMLSNALDGLGKGFSVVEILWDRSGPTWEPRRYRWRDPRFFQFDREDGETLRLLDEADTMDGLPLAPYKFIIHMPQLKSGLPIRNGLARLVALPYMCKSYTLADWMAFAEVFGMPLRVGRHSPSATEEDIRKLLTAVANLATDAACAIPDNMRIEFVEAGKASGGHVLFLNQAEYLDKQTSKAVLGQTMTTDDGSSRSQAEVHNEVRQDIQEDDAEQLADTINRDLVIPYIQLNFGPQENYPLFTLPVPKPEDIAALGEFISNCGEHVVDLELEVGQIRDKLGFADPDPGAAILGQSMRERAAQQTTLESQTTAANALDRALNRQSAGLVEPDELDDVAELEEELLAEWEPAMEPVVNPVLQLAEDVSSLEEFRWRLPELVDRMDFTALVQALAEAAFKARGQGDGQAPATLETEDEV